MWLSDRRLVLISNSVSRVLVCMRGFGGWKSDQRTL